VGKSVEVVRAYLAEPATIPGRGASPMTSTESAFARVLADIVSVERGSVDRHFLPLWVRVRKRADLSSESMKDHRPRRPIRSLTEGDLPCTAGVHSQKIIFDLRGLTPTGVGGCPPSAIGTSCRILFPVKRPSRARRDARPRDVDDFFHKLRRYG
jgi:hypothetical protein